MNNRKTQEKLLNTENLTLQLAIEIVKRAENTEEGIKELTTSDGASGGSTRAEVPNVVTVVHSKAKWGKKSSTSQKLEKNVKEVLCYRCGLKGHLASDTRCPAIKQVCRKCKGKGHFARVCKNKENKLHSKAKGVNFVDDDEDFDSSSSDEVLQVCEINTLQHADNPICDITVDGIIVSVVADSRPRYTLIDESLLSKFKNKTVFPPDIRLVAYGNKPIKTWVISLLSWDFRVLLLHPKFISLKMGHAC